ncbi:2793_t:CDS:1, partial [Paraglomus brasilianum]
METNVVLQKSTRAPLAEIDQILSNIHQNMQTTGSMVAAKDASTITDKLLLRHRRPGVLGPPQRIPLKDSTSRDEISIATNRLVHPRRARLAATTKANCPLVNTRFGQISNGNSIQNENDARVFAPKDINTISNNQRESSGNSQSVHNRVNSNGNSNQNEYDAKMSAPKDIDTIGNNQRESSGNSQIVHSR